MVETNHMVFFSRSFMVVLMAVQIDLFLLLVYVYPLDYLGYTSLAIKLKIRDSCLWPFYYKSMLVLLLIVGCINVGSSKLCSIHLSMLAYIPVSQSHLYGCFVCFCNCIDQMTS